MHRSAGRVPHKVTAIAGVAHAFDVAPPIDPVSTDLGTVGGSGGTGPGVPGGVVGIRADQLA
jgi:hypothetical protein